MDPVLSADLFRFTAIVFCFFLARGRTGTALFFTLWADSFLIFTTRYDWGVLLFCFAQLFHLPKEKRRAAVNILPLPVLFFFFAGLLPAALLAYVPLLLWNTALAFRDGPTVRKWGFLLFCCCDAAVAFSRFFPGAASFIWPFYLPSQVLLALNSRKECAPVPE